MKHFQITSTGNLLTIETDHKTLVPLLNSKGLNALPPRVLRFWLRMDWFDYIITHVPGKFLYIDDNLSTPINDEENELHLQKLTDVRNGHRFFTCQFKKTGHIKLKRKTLNVSLSSTIAKQYGHQVKQMSSSSLDLSGRHDIISQL